MLTMPVDYGGISGRMLLPEIEDEDEEENATLADAEVNSIAEVTAEDEVEGEAGSQGGGFRSIR